MASIGRQLRTVAASVVAILLASPPAWSQVGERAAQRLEVYPLRGLDRRLPKLRKAPPKKGSVLSSQGAYRVPRGNRAHGFSKMLTLRALWMRMLEVERGRPLGKDETLQVSSGAGVLSGGEELHAAAKDLAEASPRGHGIGEGCLSGPVVGEGAGEALRGALRCRSSTSRASMLHSWLRSRTVRKSVSPNGCWRDRALQRVQVPRVISRPAQLMRLLKAKQHAYIKDFRVTKLVDGVTIADPIVETIEDGFACMMRAVRLRDDRVHLELATDGRGADATDRERTRSSFPCPGANEGHDPASRS